MIFRSPATKGRMRDNRDPPRQPGAKKLPKPTPCESASDDFDVSKYAPYMLPHAGTNVY